MRGVLLTNKILVVQSPVRLSSQGSHSNLFRFLTPRVTSPWTGRRTARSDPRPVLVSLGYLVFDRFIVRFL